MQEIEDRYCVSIHRIKLFVNVVCLPTKHQEFTTTCLKCPSVHSRIECSGKTSQQASVSTAFLSSPKLPLMLLFNNEEV